MADLNEVRLIGRLTRDPELRRTSTEQYVASFGLATGRKFKGQDGVMREETTFVDITCWARLAENVSKYMKKGRLIFVGGRLKFESWDDRETGKKHTKLSVVAENIQFLDSKRDEDAQPPIEGGAPVPLHNSGKDKGAAPAADGPATWDEPRVDEPPF